MGNLIADIFITTKNTTAERFEVTKRSLESFYDNTNRDLYRLWFVDDSSGYEGFGHWGMAEAYMNDRLNPGSPTFCYVEHRANMGLGPTINQMLSMIDAQKRWDGADAPPLTIMLQDDILYSEGWLERLSRMFLLLEKQHGLVFASGIESIEHPMRSDLGNGMVLKDWIRATCMLARHETWMSMWPISRIDPETGRERGRPNDGMGSSVDWWFVRNHENSVCRTGRTNLVIPGLLQHIGYDRSTWLDRELPESDSDKEKMKR